MKPVAESIHAALESICGIDTSDASSLAYVSGLLAIGMTVPDVIPDEISFEALVDDDGLLTIEAEDLEIGAEIRSAINVIANHYYQSVRLNLAVRVH